MLQVVDLAFVSIQVHCLRFRDVEVVGSLAVAPGNEKLRSSWVQFWTRKLPRSSGIADFDGFVP